MLGRHPQLPVALHPCPPRAPACRQGGCTGALGGLPRSLGNHREGHAARLGLVLQPPCVLPFATLLLVLGPQNRGRPSTPEEGGTCRAEEGDVEDVGCMWCRGVGGGSSRDQEGYMSLALLSALGPCGPGESWPVQVVKERSGREVGEGEHPGGRLRGALPRLAGRWSGQTGTPMDLAV